MPTKPNSNKDPGKRAYRAIGRTIKVAPKTKTPSYTKDEVTKEQLKRNKKPSLINKSTGYSGATRV